MSWTPFFSGKSDTNLNRGFVGDRSDFFLAKISESYITGTSDLTDLSAVTFTVAAADWNGTSATASDYVSGYLFVQNDDGLGVVLDITVSAAGSAPVFTVDLTDSFFGRDESGNFTTATDYVFHVVYFDHESYEIAEAQVWPIIKKVTSAELLGEREIKH